MNDRYELQKIEVTEYEEMLKADPLGKIVLGALHHEEDRYHVGWRYGNNAAEFFRVYDELYDSTEIFKVQGLHSPHTYKDKEKLHVDVNGSGGNVILAVRFKEPVHNDPAALPTYYDIIHYNTEKSASGQEYIPEIDIGVGFWNDSFSKLVTEKLTESFGLWLWSEGRVKVERKDILDPEGAFKPEAVLHYDDVECAPEQYVIRGIAQAFYRDILSDFNRYGHKLNGWIWYNYASYNSPEIVNKAEKSAFIPWV